LSSSGSGAENLTAVSNTQDGQIGRRGHLRAVPS